MERRRSQRSVPRFAERAVLTMTWDRMEACLIRQLIDSYGIPCEVLCDAPDRLFPVCVDEAAGYRVVVGRRDLDSSRQLLAEHLREGLRVLPGGRAEPRGAPSRERLGGE